MEAQIFQGLEDILNGWDPIGIFFTDKPTFYGKIIGEYTKYIPTIIGKYLADKTGELLHVYLIELQVYLTNDPNEEQMNEINLTKVKILAFLSTYNDGELFLISERSN